MKFVADENASHHTCKKPENPFHIHRLSGQSFFLEFVLQKIADMKPYDVHIRLVGDSVDGLFIGGHGHVCNPSV